MMKKIVLATVLMLTMLPCSAMEGDDENVVSKHFKTAKNFTDECSRAFWDYFKISFLCNVVSDTTQKQKLIGNGAGIMFSLIKYYDEARYKTCRPLLHTRGYLWGALAGSLTREALNTTLIPLTVYTFKKGLQYIKR